MFTLFGGMNWQTNSCLCIFSWARRKFLTCFSFKKTIGWSFVPWIQRWTQEWETEKQRSDWRRVGEGRKRGRGIEFPLTVCLGSSIWSSLRCSLCGSSSTPRSLFLLLGQSRFGMEGTGILGHWQVLPSGSQPVLLSVTKVKVFANLNKNIRWKILNLTKKI